MGFDQTPLTDEQYMGAIDLILEMCEPHERLPFLNGILADLSNTHPEPSQPVSA